MTESKKNEIWLHMMALPKSYRGNGLTDRRCERLKQIIWQDNAFWADIILRHNLTRQTLDELNASAPDLYVHCVGNFWGMMYQDAVRHEVIGP